MARSPMTISRRFAQRKEEGKGVLIPYLTAGYPDAESSLELMSGLAEAGADILELGIPFSDPLADGPTIQRSSFLALEEGMTVGGALSMLRTFRTTSDLPVVLFTYLNPVLRFGMEAFLEEAVEAGAQGLLLTDLPTGSDAKLEGQVIQSELDLIRLLAPTTPRTRIARVAEGGSGFLYYISRTGVTGARVELREELGREVADIRREVSLPIAVGFGISTPRQAAEVGGVADGVVVGSALMNALEKSGVDGAVDFIATLRAAMDE